MMDTLTVAASGIRHQASGIRHQASGIRHQASGKKSNHSLKGAFLFLVIVFSMMAMVKPAQAEGTVLPPYNNYCVTFYYLGGLVRTTCLSSYDAACSRWDAAAFFSVECGNLCVTNISCRRPGYVTAQSHGITKTCPPNSTGSPSINPSTCTCKDSYVADAAGKSCVKEQYAIALHGLGGVVMPTKTRTAYAEVTKSDGSPKSGASISLLLTVEPENGVPIRAEHVGSVSPNGGSTGSDGRLNFVFTAPQAGGTHTIAASCPTCTNIFDQGTITVPGCDVDDIREVEDIPPNGPDVLPLTQVLERTWGEGLALLPAAQAGVDCVKAKLPGVKISGGTRTVAYQAHLREVWYKLIELNNLKDPVQIQACKPLRDKIMAHNSCGGNGHCITYEPAINSDHPRGDAFDISGIEDLLGNLRPPTDLQHPPLTPAQERQADLQLIADWLASPPTCNLVWGGSYGDRVHFSIP